MPHRTRRWLSIVLAVVSSLLVVLSTVSLWAHRTVFDTDRFMSTVEPVLDEPALYAVLSDAVSEQTLEMLDLEERVSDQLTQLDGLIGALVADSDIDLGGSRILSRLGQPSLTSLEPAITAALEDRVEQIVDRLVSSERFEQRLATLVRNAHEATVALIRNDVTERANVYVTDDEVRVNLIPIIADGLRSIGAELGDLLPDLQLPEVISTRVDAGRQQLADALEARIPEGAGQITLMSRDSYSGARNLVHRLDQLVWAALILTVVMIAATVAISPDRRRAVMHLGIGITIGLIVGAVLITVLRDAVVAETSTPNGRQVAETLLGTLTSSYMTRALLVGATALAAAAIAYVAGRPSWLRPGQGD